MMCACQETRLIFLSLFSSFSVKQIVNRANPQDLMLAYNIPHFAAGDIETFLISVARAQGRIRKVSIGQG
jgi:hypothetical protein